jgi:hypothetical protein
MGFNKEFMKKRILVMVLCGGVLTVRGQGATETMLQQIAALKALIGATEKGYQVARQGLTRVREIRQGEFDLHSVYFGSLWVVDTGVRQLPVVAAVLRWQGVIRGAFGAAMMRYRVSGWLQPGERSYVAFLYTKVLNDCQQDVAAGEVLIRDGLLQMTDGERVRRLSAIENRMGERAGLVQAFLFSTDLLLGRRQEAGGFVGMLSTLYNLQ